MTSGVIQGINEVILIMTRVMTNLLLFMLVRIGKHQHVLMCKFPVKFLIEQACLKYSLANLERQLITRVLISRALWWVCVF